VLAEFKLALGLTHAGIEEDTRTTVQKRMGDRKGLEFE